MQINTSLSTDSNNPAPVKNRLVASASTQPAPTQQSVVPEFDLARLQSLNGDTTIPDEAGANQALAFLKTNFLSDPASASAAQGNLNPESVYALLAGPAATD